MKFGERHQKLWQKFQEISTKTRPLSSQLISLCNNMVNELSAKLTIAENTENINYYTRLLFQVRLTNRTAYDGHKGFQLYGQ